MSREKQYLAYWMVVWTKEVYLRISVKYMDAFRNRKAKFTPTRIWSFCFSTWILYTQNSELFWGEGHVVGTCDCGNEKFGFHTMWEISLLIFGNCLLTFRSLAISLRTTRFNIQISTWCSLYIECCIGISEKTATFAVYIINWMVFIAVVESVYSTVRTYSLYKAEYISSLKG